MEKTLIVSHAFNGFAATVEVCEANGAVKRSSTATGTTSNKLVDSGASFTSGTTVDVGDEVFNSTDSTYAYVTAVDSATQLSLSADIMVSGEAYTIQGEFTHSITDSDMGTTDAANIDPVAYPVIAGDNTYEKYQKIHVTNMGGSSEINTLKFWRTGSLGGSAVHKTNARETSYARKPYVAPSTTTSTQGTQTTPTSEPTGANVGIAGSLAGTITTAGATSYSDFIVHQIQTNVADTVGATTTLNYQYSEVA